MHSGAASSAKRDQILMRIVARMAPKFFVVDLKIYCLVPGTPLPYRVQNLENKGSNFSLFARSLSLQDLHAKSREHGS
jgi:hypothetical protein